MQPIQDGTIGLIEFKIDNMKKTKLNWKLTFSPGANMVPNINPKKMVKAWYSEVNGIRTFHVKCSQSDISQFIKLQALKISSGQNGTIDVACDEHQLWQLFEKIFMEIFELMEVDSIIFQEAYNAIITKYGAFLEEMKYLSKEKQIGLLAELIFLEELLKIDNKALNYWIDANEDFKIRSKYVEIKSTRAKVHKHIINGLNQLTLMPNTQKYLASYLVEDNESEKTIYSINLPSQTKKILDLLNVKDKSTFKQKLINRKYLHDANGNDYEEFNFTFSDPIYAEVDVNFPRLDIYSVPHSLHGNIPPGKVEYELNLHSVLNLFQPINQNNLERDFF